MLVRRRHVRIEVEQTTVRIVATVNPTEENVVGVEGASASDLPPSESRLPKATAPVVPAPVAPAPLSPLQLPSPKGLPHAL